MAGSSGVSVLGEMTAAIMDHKAEKAAKSQLTPLVSEAPATLRATKTVGPKGEQIYTLSPEQIEQIKATTPAPTGDFHTQYDDVEQAIARAQAGIKAAIKLLQDVSVELSNGSLYNTMGPSEAKTPTMILAAQIAAEKAAAVKAVEAAADAAAAARKAGAALASASNDDVVALKETAQAAAAAIITGGTDDEIEAAIAAVEGKEPEQLGDRIARLAKEAQAQVFESVEPAVTPAEDGWQCPKHHQFEGRVSPRRGVAFRACPVVGCVEFEKL